MENKDIKILDAEIEWNYHWANEPDLKILLSHEVNYDEFRFSVERGSIYYAESGGFVRFFSYRGPDEGFGGYSFPIIMQGGQEKVLKGPWSSRASVINTFTSGPKCSEVSFTSDPKVMHRGHTFYHGISLTVPRLLEALSLCAANLVATEQHGELSFTFIDARNPFGWHKKGGNINKTTKFLGIIRKEEDYAQIQNARIPQAS